MNVASGTCIVTLGVIALTGSVRQGAIVARNQGAEPARTAIRDGLAGVELMDGDIIFRRTDALRGRVARTTDLHADYSHAGLLSLKDGNRTVIHADPARLGAARGRVVETTLDGFIGDSTVVRVAVYRLRLRDDTRMVHAMRWAGGHAARGTPFDNDFNLSDSTAMYCTELVWRAYRVVGLEVGPPTRRAARSLFLVDSLMLLSSIQHSPLLHEVYVSLQH